MPVDLPYEPPLDWAALAGFLQARATPGVERVQGGVYERVLGVAGEAVMVRVSPHQRAVLSLEVEAAGQAVSEVAARARRVFDLDCDPAVIAGALSADPLLAAPLLAHPGLRVPGAWDPFELCVRAVVGQQITVRAATTLTARLADRWGSPVEVGGFTRLFPTPHQLADAPLETAGLIRSRATTIRAIATAMAAGALSLDGDGAVAALRAIPGIGVWTAQYIAMRVRRDADAFPSGDVVLRRMAGGLTARELDRRAERWRPWRAYAVMQLWQAATDITIQTDSRARRR